MASSFVKIVTFTISKASSLKINSYNNLYRFKPIKTISLLVNFYFLFISTIM